MTVAIEGNEKSGWKPAEPQPFANSLVYEMEPAFSPDGRRLAYASNESGSFEVYVRAFPGSSGKSQVSNGGGNFPKWSSNGELFYRTPDNKITVVTYTGSGDSFRADKPRLWSPGEFPDHWLGLLMYNFDPHPDGKRFVVLKVPDTKRNAAVNKVNMILNWFEELKQRVQVH